MATEAEYGETPVEQIRYEADRIYTATEEIERLAATSLDNGDDWRTVLGYVETASRRLYGLKKNLLTEAMRQAAENVAERTETE